MPTAGSRTPQSLEVPAIIGVLLALATSLGAQESGTPPFSVGERLEYRVRVSRVGASGKSSMTVEGPTHVRGRDAYLLRFDFRAGFGPIKATDRTQSWIDPIRMVALRFEKHERHPLSSGDESVDLFPGERRWEGEGGMSGESTTDEPLDELSFIYFIRTLPFVDDTLYEFDRHYLPERNPISVRVVGRETITTGVGKLKTVVVEMRVRDARRYRDGFGLIRIHFTDDARRIPARIESEMPVVGKAVMTLSSWTDAVVPGKP
ncbi:MAG: DUF3108 domain-containing protein [Gemmatimonadaceae bacterium]